MGFSKMVFVCSPYGGKEENIQLARRFMRMAAGFRYTPVAPHVMLHGVLDDHIPEHRAAGLELSTECFIPMCWEFWVCGDSLSAGMAFEKSIAEAAGIRIREVSLGQLVSWESLQGLHHRFRMYHDWQAGASLDRISFLYQSSPHMVKKILEAMYEVGEVSRLRIFDV